MEKLTFKEFLKKYSTLSNEFIDDFYKIYDYNIYNNNDFIIDLSIIAKWLKCEKGKLKKTLIASYNVNIDYIVNKNKPGKYQNQIQKLYC